MFWSSIAYDPKHTPTSFMGIIAETFRNFDGVIRSSHPSVSFTSWGKNAELITRNHSIDDSLGENSPLARVYDLDGWVLLLGVGHDRNTSFHLAEYRASNASPTKAGAPIEQNGDRIWKTYDDIEFNTEVFDDMGKDFKKDKGIIQGLVGSTECRLFKQRSAVDFAKEWIIKNNKS